jgi:hypothetical protein
LVSKETKAVNGSIVPLPNCRIVKLPHLHICIFAYLHIHTAYVFFHNSHSFSPKSMLMKITGRLFLLPTLFVILAVGCKKPATDEGTTNGANLVLKFRVDPTQARLNNIGQPSDIASGNAAQSPLFNKMSAHYVELAPTMWTALGAGAVVYKAPETTVGGARAIDFEKASFAGQGETFLTVPLKDITPGEYEWLRVSLAYQNFDVKLYIDTVINGIAIQTELPGTAAGFIGYNTYIKNLLIKKETVAVNANKKQGFWGFETDFTYAGTTYPFSSTGQAPEGATTVVNPLFATSPIPQGSCVVTSAISPGKLKITGTETKDIVIEVSLSTNKSFEWKEVVFDGKWEPSKGESVVDMGIRGMQASLQ